VEHNYGAAVESLLKNGDSRIRLERQVDKRICLLGRWAGVAARERDCPTMNRAGSAPGGARLRRCGEEPSGE
jgi:hypothetical protein